MDLYLVSSIIIASAILLAYVCTRLTKMPTTIALMGAALLLSLSLIVLNHYHFIQITKPFKHFMNHIDFRHLLLNGMLSYLLFAGSLNIDIKHLRERTWEVITLACFSTIASTVLLGFIMYGLLNVFHIQVSLLYCFLFGALISPTDPIAVLAIFRRLKAPERLHVLVECESLFNDGVAIVLFLTLYHFAFSGTSITTANVLSLFIEKAIGGIAYGIVLGVLAYKLIKPLNHTRLEILMTITIPSGGYALAEFLGISGPLAMVVAGIFLGNRGNLFSISGRTKENLNTFWSLVDEVLNMILFMLIGLELLFLNINHSDIMASIIAIPTVLFIRFVTVAIPISIFKRYKQYSPYIISILTWGGLRGGLAVALALTIPASPSRNLILTMTYAIVIFAIIVQGLTIKPLVKKSRRELDAVK